MITSCIVNDERTGGSGNSDGEPTQKEIIKKLKLMGWQKESIGNIEIWKNDFYPDFNFWCFTFDIIPKFTIYRM